MGHQTCPTVAIQGEPSDGNPSGIVVINESDFNEDTMKLAEPTKAIDPVEVVAPVAVANNKSAKAVAPWAAE